MKLRGRTQICYYGLPHPSGLLLLMKCHPRLEYAPSYLLWDHPHLFMRSFQGQMSKHVGAGHVFGVTAGIVKSRLNIVMKNGQQTQCQIPGPLTILLVQIIDVLYYEPGFMLSSNRCPDTCSFSTPPTLTQ